MLEYIIVGLGLSGTSIAFRLEEMGKSFVVYEDTTQNSSKVAGGMMNPVILKRFTLAWEADLQLQIASRFYKRLEHHLKDKFIYPAEIFRKFSSAEEQNNWFAASDNPRLSPFLDTNLYPELNPAIPAGYSFGKVKGIARVDAKKLLAAYTSHLKKIKRLEQSHFAYEEVKVLEDCFEYRGKKARKIVFCEGFGLKKNPFFNYLPLKGNKGEYITIRSPELNLQEIVKSSVFIFPLGGDLYSVGATYNNLDKTQSPTPAARKELQEKLNKLINVNYEVTDQISGIRPTTGDRRPLVGEHPELKNMYCCNGFGSRGFLMAPGISKELLDLAEKGKDLSSEIDLSRFIKKRYPPAN